MKYCIVIADGVAGAAADELDGRTPLDAANTPNFDRASMLGRQGTLQTVPEGMDPAAGMAVLSILGIDPATSYTGLGPLEAAGLDIELGPGDVVFRCNLVTVDDGRMLDATAGGIRQAEASALIDALTERLATADVSFHHGAGYQNLMIYSGREDVSAKCVPPQEILGEEMAKSMPRGPGERLLRGLIERSPAALEAHDVNLVRVDHGESPATMIWLWGGGKAAGIRPFAEQFGKTGAVVSASNAVKGIAKNLGLTCVDIKGGPGEPDTNRAAMAEAAISSLDTHDLAVLHVVAAGEGGDALTAAERIRTIEDIDGQIVGRILDALLGQADARVLIAAGRGAHAATRAGARQPIPFAMCGARVRPVHELSFSEKSAAGTGLRIEHGHELMAYFLRE